MGKGAESGNTGWLAATRGERPADAAAAAKNAAEVAVTQAKAIAAALKADGVDPHEADRRCRDLYRWAKHVVTWQIPLPPQDVRDVLAGDAVLQAVGQRRRPRTDGDRKAQARGTWLREAAGVGDAIHALFGAVPWNPDLDQASLVEHRSGLLAALDEDLSGELFGLPAAHTPAIRFESLEPGEYGSYPDPTAFPSRPNFRDPAQAAAVAVWDAERQVTLNEDLLNSPDPWDAVSTLVHERAHDVQWARECGRYFVGMERSGDVAEFVTNQRDYVSAGDGYPAQPLEDDAFRREAVALLRWSLRQTGHCDHAIPLTDSPYRIVRLFRGGLA